MPDALAAALRVVLAAAATYVVLCAVLWALQERLIFHPRPLGTPPSHPAARPLELANGDATLRGWIVNEDHVGPVIVYFGGNAEEVSLNLPQWATLPATTVLMNYRGFGESTGTPSEAHLVDDAAAILRWSKVRWPKRPLIAFGVSLGSGVAVLAVARTGADAIVLVSPYRSVTNIAHRRFPFVPVRWLLRHTFHAVAHVDAMPRTLVFASPTDMVIPYEESVGMVAVLGDRTDFHSYPLSHNALMDHRPLWREVVAFLQTVH